MIPPALVGLLTRVDGYTPAGLWAAGDALQELPVLTLHQPQPQPPTPARGEVDDVHKALPMAVSARTLSTPRAVLERGRTGMPTG
ncbi:hypothetical protein [Streptomyces sp. NPDC101776]|uniref:hypothetical protein n=1 Tax=Streptomyces sp. NPDC101776 TaxID=3366146 RepID=UPI00381153C1